MVKKLIISKNRKILYVSLFNLKLFKRFLITKLFLVKNKKIRFQCLVRGKYNIVVEKKEFIKKFFNRKEIVPFRLLKFFNYLDIEKLKLNNLLFILTEKYRIHNGKMFKTVNMLKGNIYKMLQCKFRFGDLILTKTSFVFGKKKFKKGKLQQKKKK